VAIVGEALISVHTAVTVVTEVIACRAGAWIVRKRMLDTGTVEIFALWFSIVPKFSKCKNIHHNDYTCIMKFTYKKHLHYLL
jgi:hypothetical protein